MPAQFHAIYSRLKELARPYQLPAPWNEYPADADSCCLPDPAAALAKLRSEFSEADLLASGVACQAEGELVPNPMLMDGQRGLIVLRNQEGQAFDVMLEQGCLSGSPPMLRTHLDQRTEHALRARDDPEMSYWLFVCFHIVDVILLRALGLAATLACRMDNFNCFGLKRLLRLVGGVDQKGVAVPVIGLRGDEPHDPGKDPDRESDKPVFGMKFLACSLADLSAEVPDGMVRVARALAAATTHLGFQWRHTWACHPSAQDLETIRYRLRYGSAPLVGSYLQYNVTRYPLEAFLEPGPPKLPPSHKLPLSHKRGPAKRYLHLLSQFHRSIREMQPERWRREYGELVNECFVGPIVERALETENLLARPLLMHLAMVTRYYHDMTPIILTVEGLTGDQLYRNEGLLLPTADFKQWTDMSNEMMKVIRLLLDIEKGPRGGRS